MTRAVVATAVLVVLAACQRPPAPPVRIEPPSRPDLLAGCYALRYGGPTYRSIPWPPDWRTHFIAPDRFAVAPLLPLTDRITQGLTVIPLAWSGPTRPQVATRLTPDGTSLLIASGIAGEGVTFRLLLQGDTLPGVAALSGSRDNLKPARTVRRVMAVRVHCRTGQPLAIVRAPPRP